MNAVADPKTAAPENAQPALPGVVPYLSLDGALKATDFYKRAFAAEEVGAMPPDDQGRTMHVLLRINGGAVMLSDFYPEHGHPKLAPQGYTLHLQVTDIEAWWSRAVEAGASVVMPLADMFWGDRYGQLRDPFGVTWSLGMTPAK